MCRKCQSQSKRQPSRVNPWVLATIAVVLVSIFAASALSAQEPSHQHKSTSGAATSDIDVRYYRKKLELAKHDLQSARDANRRIPNLNSKLSMLRLENQVAYATKLVEQAGKHTDHDLHQSHLRSVKNDIILAEQQLAWAKSTRGFLREDQVKRLELAVELARLELERAEQPGITADPMQHLQWQIDRLRSELLSLQVEFERIRSGH